jgi:RNA-directed DNA polymerase
MCWYGKPENSGANKQMKRYGKLFEQIVSIENIATAHDNARRGKSHYRNVKAVDENRDECFVRIRNMLREKTFRTAPYVAMVKNEYGKERVIHKLPYFPDRIVHHAIVQVLGPIWDRTLIRDTYACIRGRGIHDGAKRIKRALHDIYGTKYCLKMDVQKFYPSMNHNVLKNIIRKKIKDHDVLWLLDEIIDSVAGDAGVPIGNYLSQFFGNLYLSGYDHWMKEMHGCRHYYRYCDDIVILGPDKTRLHDLQRLTERYWADCLQLKIKGNWQVFPVAGRGVDFLGYRFFHGYTLLRKSIAINFKRKMRSIKLKWDEMPPVSVLSSIASYGGWMGHANCHNLKSRHIDLEIKQITSLALERIKTAGGQV